MAFDRKIEEKAENDYSFDEPVDKSKDQVNVTLDKDCRAWVEELKDALDMKSDARAIKVLIEAGRNAIFCSLSAETLKYVTSRGRVRKSDYKKNGELKS